MICMILVNVYCEPECKTPLECVIKALDALKRDREEMNLVRNQMETLLLSIDKKIDDKIWSMDEQRELNLEEIEINCTFNLNARNWKEKVIINVL